MYHYLEEEIDNLKTKVIKMGSLVEEQIEFSLRCLFENNADLGRIVIERDAKVDTFDVKIDKLCQRIFALTQPVAVDLRLIMSALKINNDLERMGDIAVNIVERAKSLSGHTDLLLEAGVKEMSEKVMTMVRKTLDSIVNNDHELAVGIIKYDDVIDNIEREVFEKLITKMESEKSFIRPCISAATVVRNLERLADHSTNIAEEVIFLVDAKIIKHRKDFGGLDIKGEELEK